MLGKCFAVLCLLSVVCAAFCGNLGALTGAVLEGAAEAVRLSISLCGMLCFWNGLMGAAEEAGWLRGLTRISMPLLRRLFPRAAAEGGLEEVSACICANLLGIGNAATPLALRAMKRLQKNNPTKEIASDDMVTLTVLGTASLDFFPSTILALRHAAGAVRPSSVIVPIWICSGACAVLAVLAARVPTLCGKRHGAR